MLKYKSLKRAFTIVELVIVIAVVAILAAVLIPIFVNVTEEAKLSSDTSLVKNLNTTLAIDEALNGKPATMTDALNVAAESGYSAERLSPVSSGEIVWDSVSNRFALLNDGKVVYQDASTTALTGPAVWKMTTDVNDLNDTDFSWYLQAGEYEDIKAATGVDVGENENINVTIDTTKEATASAGAAVALSARITASAEEAKAITVRTNGGTFTINAPETTIYHYGTTNISNSDKFAALYEYSDIIIHYIGSGELFRENTYTAVVEVYSSVDITVKGTGASVGAMISPSDAVADKLSSLVAGAGAEVVTVPVASLEVNEDGSLPERVQLGTEKIPYIVNSNDVLSKIKGMSNDRDYYFLINCDIADTSALADDGWLVDFAGNITMDFAGHTLTTSDMVAFGNGIGDSLTIKNADIVIERSDSTETSGMGIIGDLTLTNCTLSAPNASLSRPHNIILLMGSDLTVDGCTFTNVQIHYNYNSYLEDLAQSGTNITLTNSTFTDYFSYSILYIYYPVADVNVKIDNCKMVSQDYYAIEGIGSSAEKDIINLDLNHLTYTRVSFQSGEPYFFYKAARATFNITENNCSYTKNGIRTTING